MKYLIPYCFCDLDSGLIEPKQPLTVESETPLGALLQAKKLIIEAELSKLPPGESTDDDPYLVWHYNYEDDIDSSLANAEDIGYVLGDPIEITPEYLITLTMQG